MALLQFFSFLSSIYSSSLHIFFAPSIFYPVTILPYSLLKNKTKKYFSFFFIYSVWNIFKIHQYVMIKWYIERRKHIFSSVVFYQKNISVLYKIRTFHRKSHAIPFQGTHLKYWQCQTGNSYKKDVLPYRKKQKELEFSQLNQNQPSNGKTLTHTKT